jgi:tRNA threonylcarbamoyladenosine biosynthesis protein TsaE
MTEIVTRSAAATEEAGRRFAEFIKPGDIIALSGTLGAGKTRFVAGVCAQLEVAGHFGSPTFTLINEYPAGGLVIVHADMYRINSRAEAAEIGLEEYFRAPYVCFIEWAEHVHALLPQGCYHIVFEHGQSETERRMRIYFPGEEPA